MFLCENNSHARFIRLFYFFLSVYETRDIDSVDYKVIHARFILILNISDTLFLLRISFLFYYKNYRYIPYNNGGGTAPNSCESSTTLLAAAHAGMPAVQTNVSEVICPCWIICSICATG